MATILSTPTMVTVNSPATTAIGVGAALMPVGTWAKLVPANDQNSILGVGGVSGTMLHYANNCAWNRFNRCIEIVGADHSYGATMRYVRFDTASNSFVLVNAGGDGLDSGTGPGHEFCGTVVNPYTGETYYRHYCSYGVSPTIVTKAALNGTAFSTAIPPSPSAIIGVNQGNCWWSGSFKSVGSQGCLMSFNPETASVYVDGGTASDGYMQWYDPLSNAWGGQTGASPFYPLSASDAAYDPANQNEFYHEVAAYSALKNVMVYGGGNAAPRKLWKMDSTGTVTRLTDVPAGKAVGIQHGNLREDPATGNFLLLSANELWELDPSGAGTWKQQTGSRTPPVDVGRPGPAAAGAIDGVVSCAIPEYGIVVYIKQTSPTNSAMYLYKHG
jgi:hypothetical protein